MKIAIVNSICATHDAISDSVLATRRAIRDSFGVDARLYLHSCDYPDVPHRLANAPVELLYDREFMKSDIIIYHFGVYYNLMNAILLDQPAKRVVYYHNVTPGHLLAPSQRALAARSVAQTSNLSAADAIWAASRFNRDDLIASGLDGARITVEPLCLKFGAAPLAKPARAGPPARLLFVGRFVPSKGVIDLIEAVSALREMGAPSFLLTLAGNQRFSDPAYLAEMKRLIAHHRLEEQIAIEGEVSDRRLSALYAEADLFVLPSYHEGFCLPLIEAMRARCVPVAYAAGNLSDLAGPWGVMVPTGDKAALAGAVLDLIGQFGDGRPATLRLRGRGVAWADYDTGVEAHLKTFSYDAFKDRIKTAIERLMTPSPGSGEATS